MVSYPQQSDESVLLITLDSCRFDTFASTPTPKLDTLGPLHRAWAPGNFTFASHMAIFMGFTPGDPAQNVSVLNPKYGKLFRMSQGGIKGHGEEAFLLEGRNIKEGFKRKGYRVLGTGAVNWFNPGTDTAAPLLADFDAFHFSEVTWGLPGQLEWVGQRLAEAKGERVFLFMNVGETHVPYYFEGAPWSRLENPCVPFGKENDPLKSRIRQGRALAYVDRALGGLLEAFSNSTVLVCADHGDCWGEEGLWEHGIHHRRVLEVPLLYRVSSCVARGGGV